LANERFAEAKVTQDGRETTVGPMIQYNRIQTSSNFLTYSDLFSRLIQCPCETH
jgi:hypothetical protein